MGFGDWLSDLGPEHYADALGQNEIEFDTRDDLAAANLEDLGVTLGERKRHLNTISESVDSVHPSEAELGRSKLHQTTPRTDADAQRQLTVMFVNLVGSTALSDRLDTEERLEPLRACRNAAIGKITCFEGLVANFMDDRRYCRLQVRSDNRHALPLFLAQLLVQRRIHLIHPPLAGSARQVSIPGYREYDDDASSECVAALASQSAAGSIHSWSTSLTET